MSRAWLTVSNAFEISKKTPKEYLLEFIASLVGACVVCTALDLDPFVDSVSALLVWIISFPQWCDHWVTCEERDENADPMLPIVPMALGDYDLEVNYG